MFKRKIFLHGDLKRHSADPVMLHASTVAEAINGLCRVLNIRVSAVRGRQRVKVLGFDTAESLFEKNDREELHIVPAFTGAKGGVIQVIVGAVLVVAGTILTATGVGGPVGPFLIHAGAAMILGGLVQLLFPVPTKNGRRFSYLGEAGNTTAIGTPIAILLGEAKAFGQILSYNVEAVTSA